MNAGFPMFAQTPGSVIEGACAWLTSLLSGPITTALCTIAVAALGYSMMQGRIQMRKGIRAIIGCFVLFGAAHLADGFLKLARPSSSIEPQIITINASPAPQTPLPPANYDPYAGAAVRTDR